MTAPLPPLEHACNLFTWGLMGAWIVTALIDPVINICRRRTMSTGIDLHQLRDLVITPVLDLLGLGGAAVEELVLGTLLQESGGGHYLRQLGAGPAIGIGEMEPATHDDIWKTFLPAHPDLSAKISTLLVEGLPKAAQMAGNLYYAVAMTRLFYYRVSAPLPAAGDLSGQAAYYKTHYNTAGGAATTAEYIANWQRAFGQTA
jgi:hypothetical protein